MNCCEDVHNEGRSVGFHKCPWSATVERDGKWYCRRHDPEAVAARDAARRARWEQERQRDAHARDRGAIIRVLQLLREREQYETAGKIEAFFHKELTE